MDVALTDVLLGIAAISLPCNSLKRQVDDTARDLRISFAITSGLAGFYLFLSGVAISLIWLFALTSGVFNVFGGMATLG